MALVRADFPTDDKEKRIRNLKESLVLFERALEFYDQALDINEDNLDCQEVYTSEQILKHRKLRTVGARAPKASDLYGLTLGEQREEWRNKALLWAMEEVQLREELGETKGPGLANAYHTLGYVITEYVDPENSLAYQGARDAFEKAARVPDAAENTKVVIDFCLAWLEYKRDPKNKVAVGKEFDKFLSGLDKLTEANKNSHSLLCRIEKVADSLGEEYQLKVAEAFKGVYLPVTSPSSG